MDNSTSNLIGYARVSMRSQNLETQRGLLHRAGCIRVFEDSGSGKTSRARTQLGQMLDYLRPGDVVVVTKLDRLSRSMMDLLSLSQTIHDKGAELRSLSEDLDTTTSAGRLIFHVMGVLAEYERERIRERTLEGLEEARKQGRVGGRPPVLNERQLRMVMRMRAEGESLREIARTFNVSVGTVHRAVRRETAKKAV